MVSGSLVRYSPPSFNLLDLPDDILGLIWDEKLKLEKTERRRSLIAKHGWRFNCIWGGEGREEKDAKYKEIGFYHHETNSYDPYFFLHFLEKGKDVEECSVMYYEDEKIVLPGGGLLDAKGWKHDLSSLNVYQVEDFFKMYFFYENLVEAICLKCGDDCYDEYKFERMEDINPFIAARDTTIAFGDCEIELELGKETTKIYDALTEAAWEWAIDNFFDDETNTLYSRVLDLLSDVIYGMSCDDDYKNKFKKDGVDLDESVVEDFINTKYDAGQLYEASESEFNCGLWLYLVKNGFDDPYCVIDYLNKEYNPPE